MRLLSIILPLAYNNGLPYVREQGLDILIDSGAGRSYLSQAVLDEDGPLAARARAEHRPEPDAVRHDHGQARGCVRGEEGAARGQPMVGARVSFAGEARARAMGEGGVSRSPRRANRVSQSCVSF